MMARHALDAALDALARDIPLILASNPDDADFWPVFAGLADELVDGAGASDVDHVVVRIEAMLGACGKGAAPPGA